MKTGKQEKTHTGNRLEKPDKGSIGRAGEFLVAFELERHGFTAAALFANAKDFDILAIDKKSGESIAVQVKTSWHPTRQWVLAPKAEEIKRDNVFYVFVSLNDGGVPSLYIVPSGTVAEAVRKDHKEWLGKKGPKGNAHHDNAIRKFRIVEDEYLDNWDVLRRKCHEGSVDAK